MLDSLRTAQKSDFEKIISEETESAPLIPTLYLRKDRPLPGQEVSDKATVGGAKGNTIGATYTVLTRCNRRYNFI
jgi:hypothetical protein